MKDPWEKAYAYTRNSYGGTVAHVAAWWRDEALCKTWVNHYNRTPKPYRVCKNCLRTKRAKELGL